MKTLGNLKISRELVFISAAMLIWGLGEGLFIFFYPLSLQHFNANSVQIGTVLSAIGVMMALVQVPAGYLSDRVGSRPLIRAAMILGVFSTFLMVSAKTLSVFTIGIIAYGATSFIGAPLNSYITSIRGDWSVQRALTFVSASVQVGAILGPILGGWIGENAGISTVFLCAAGLFSISTLIILLIKGSGSKVEEENPVARINPLTNPRFLGFMVVTFLTIIALSTPQQLTSIYLQKVHSLSLQQIGITGTAAGIGAAVIMFTLGNLRAPLGMIAGQVLLGLFCLFMWRGQTPLIFYCGYLFVGGYRLYRSMTLAYARPMVNTENVGLAYSLVETANALAVILAPLAAGFLYNQRPELVYIVSLMVLALTVSVTLIMMRKTKIRESGR